MRLVLLFALFSLLAAGCATSPVHDQAAGQPDSAVGTLVWDGLYACPRSIDDVPVNCGAGKARMLPGRRRVDVDVSIGASIMLPKSRLRHEFAIFVEPGHQYSINTMRQRSLAQFRDYFWIADDTAGQVLYGVAPKP